MNAFKITLTDGDHWITSMNATIAEARDYFLSYCHVTEADDGSETKRWVASVEQVFAPGDRVEIEWSIYSERLRRQELRWLPATFLQYVSATDRTHRLMIETDGGWIADSAAPECVRAATY